MFDASAKIISRIRKTRKTRFKTLIAARKAIIKFKGKGLNPSIRKVDLVKLRFQSRNFGKRGKNRR